MQESSSSRRVEVLRRHVFSKTSDRRHVFNKTSDRRHDEFLYSINKSGLLTYEQRLFYENNGYLVYPDLISHQLLDLFDQRFKDLCDKKFDKGNIILMKDISVVKNSDDKSKIGEALYYKAQDILYDDVFQKYFLNDKLLDVVECFIGSDITAMHSMLINKPPDVGTLSSRHPLHQDLYYFPFRPANRVVASWTAMEKVDQNNGCLFVLPGTHKGNLLQHEYPKWEGGVNKAFYEIPFKDNYLKQYLTMEKGETVFFHPLLIHGSGYNSTSGYRKAISGHFAASDCYYIDVKGTIQETVAKEVEDVALKHYGYLLTIQDAFRFRLRHLRGKMYPSLT